MRTALVAFVACLLVAPRANSADGQAKKWLVGRWAPVVAKPADPAEKAQTPAPAPKSKGSVKGKKSAKKSAPKPPAELPKVLLEFTKDGKIRLDGDPSVLGDKLRFNKPLAAFSMRMSPQNKFLKVAYEISADDTVQVSADHSWLLEKLSGGGAVPPDKAQELDKEYRPREVLKVAATSQELTLTTEQGETLKFRRYTGDPLDVAESKRTASQMREGMAPLEAFMRQQGINVGTPPPDAPPADGSATTKPGSKKSKKSAKSK